MQAYVNKDTDLPTLCVLQRRPRRNAGALDQHPLWALRFQEKPPPAASSWGFSDTTHDLQRHATLGLKLRTSLYNCELSQTFLPGHRIILGLLIC